MSILTETAPRTIWLCVSDDEDDYELPYPELYAEDAEITWSTDQPVAVTVKYERSDIADNARVENEELRADLAAARALLTEARATLPDMRHTERLCARIDAVLVKGGPS